MNNLYTEYHLIESKVKNRSVFLFGAGEISSRTKRRLHVPYTCIVDNNPELHGMTENGLKIIPFSSITNEETPFFIICTTSFPDIATQLKEHGFIAGDDFVVSPALNNYQIVEKILSLKSRFIFSSGYPVDSAKDRGGGVYLVELDGQKWDYKKIYSGICHGILLHEEDILFVDQIKGIVKMSKNLDVKKTYSVPNGSRCHGLAFNNLSKRFYSCASHSEMVYEFDSDFQLINQYPISDKLKYDGVPSHHINDICSVGSSIYVSMFSYTGNFRREIFDGVVVEYSTTDFRERGIVIDNLWMPHNVEYLAGSLTVLDSLRGNLIRNNSLNVGKFPGFTRGLDYNDGLFYVGQSRNRNFSKVLGVSNNISLDSGITVFDEKSKVSRNLSLPPAISEIHSIRILD